VTQGEGPEFKPQYHKKERKKSGTHEEAGKYSHKVRQGNQNGSRNVTDIRISRAGYLKTTMITTFHLFNELKE
jgi:hypothetical protein